MENKIQATKNHVEFAQIEGQAGSVYSKNELKLMSIQQEEAMERMREEQKDR